MVSLIVLCHHTVQEGRSRWMTKFLEQVATKCTRLRPRAFKKERQRGGAASGRWSGHTKKISLKPRCSLWREGEEARERERERWGEIECVCVCHAPSQGVFAGSCRGARPVTSDLAQRSWDVTEEAPREALACTCKTTVVHAVYFLGLLPWSFS